MKDKHYKICDYFKDDFEDKSAIENYEGVVYDQALDIINQMFSSPDWIVNDNAEFYISFQPYEIDNNSMNMNKNPMEINYYLCSVIENILRNFGIDDIDCTRSSYSIPNSDKIKGSFKFKVTIPIEVFKNLLNTYYGILQSMEYQTKTIKGEYKYDSKLNKSANFIIDNFFTKAQNDFCNGKSIRSIIVMDNAANNLFSHDMKKVITLLYSPDEYKRFDLLIKLIESKLNCISSEGITLQRRYFHEFSISCSDLDYDNFRDIYNEEKESHVLKKEL